MDDAQEVQIPIRLPEAMMGGTYANFATVVHSEHEFTVDFVRLDFASKQGIVVSRVALSPLMVTQLIDALQTNWAGYAKKALPREVNDGDDRV